MIDSTRPALRIAWSQLVASHVTKGLWLLQVAVMLLPPAAHAQSADAEASRLVSEYCSGCHGPGGNSVAPTTPKLAAQQEAYLVKQVHDFSSGIRHEKGAHSFMRDTAALLNEDVTQSLARYYARQKITSAAPGEVFRLARGKLLYEQSQLGEGPACSDCHGAQAEGAGITPRLAGQHAIYIQHQLRAMRLKNRDQQSKHGIVDSLSKDQAADLAAYLQSL